MLIGIISSFRNSANSLILLIQIPDNGYIQISGHSFNWMVTLICQCLNYVLRLNDYYGNYSVHVIYADWHIQMSEESYYLLVTVVCQLPEL